MSNAPERIWLTSFTKEEYGARLGRGQVSDLDHNPNPDYPEYILAALEPASWITNCAVCGRLVDTREKAEGGDGHGCEYSNGWTCSTDCAERMNPDPDWMKNGLSIASTLSSDQMAAQSDDMDAFLVWLDSLFKEPNNTVKAAFAAYKAIVRPAPDLAELVEAASRLLGMVDELIAESGRSIEWGEEDPFRMGEWFEPEDLAQIEQARAALAKIKEPQT